MSGFYELAHAGIIDLKVRASDSWSESSCAVGARIEGRTRWSMSWLMAGTSLESRTRLSRPPDHYFKRSFDPAHRGDLPASLKLVPLGLNYLVISKHSSWHRGTRPPNARRMASASSRRASRALSGPGCATFGTCASRTLSALLRFTPGPPLCS